MKIDEKSTTTQNQALETTSITSSSNKLPKNSNIAQSEKETQTTDRHSYTWKTWFNIEILTILTYTWTCVYEIVDITER